MKDLSQVIQDIRARAALLDEIGATPGIAKTLTDVARDVEDAASNFLVWVSETEAAAYSGQSKRWLYARFLQWESDGNAKREGRKRIYRRIVLPIRQVRPGPR